ncbi:hypothetical protein LLH23_05430 [bacterium]|nr:hypothetical protein [bacterium]
MDMHASPDLLARLDALRERIFAGDNTHCFVERQHVFTELAAELDGLAVETRYAAILERLLAAASTPIADEDVILGRMVEGPAPDGQTYLPSLPGFASSGHLTPDWEALLTRGLRALAAEAEETAQRLGDAEARAFAANVGRCCTAVCAFAERYAAAASALAETALPERAAELRRAAASLRACPAGPASNFAAALQGLWIVHLVLSCFIGARDFALGRLDQLLLPLYRQGLAEGTLTPDGALELLAHFLMKAKETTGTHTDSYRPKPVPCFASNQYVVLGGCAPDGTDETNELSVLFVEAARLVRMPQPELNVRLHPGTSDALRRAVERALPVCHAQLQFWNDDLIIPQLQRRGFTDDEAYGYALTACNRINIPGAMDFRGGDHFHNMPQWLLTALDRVPEAERLEDILSAFGQVAAEAVAAAVRERAERMRVGEHSFYFESALLHDCVARGRDCSRGGLRYPAQFHFFGGVATVTDSLLALEHLVFRQRRYSLREYLDIVAANFVGQEALRQEVLTALPKYGNDEAEADALAQRVCEIGLDALEAVPNPDGQLLLPAIYSLYRHVEWGQQLPATPDGRLPGEPISDNQSPVHGADRAGVTALLRSVARLPLERTPTGGLNLKLAFKPDPAAALHLVETYFALGGLHLGFTFVDRATLLAAQARPAAFRSLCVRVTGFSEFFIALSPAAQAEVIARTEH